MPELPEVETIVRDIRPALVGEFDDEFVKTPEGWRFDSRRGRVILHT